jgi:hypothetical protein
MFALVSVFWCDRLEQAARSESKSVQNKSVRRPGIEPGSTAWKATMLTITPATLLVQTISVEYTYVWRAGRARPCVYISSDLLSSL